MEAYALINKNKDILKSSSSGGVFYEFAKYVLDNNGIVFGATWNNKWLVDMIYIDKLEDIKKLQGSKYVKADNKNTFKECKDFLDDDKLVLYSGTSCQIFALKFFLKKEYDNLLTVAVSCHGTLPKQIWLDYLETWQRPAASIIKINMRSKENTTWDKFNFVIEYSDGKKLVEDHNKNKYMKAFLSDKYLNDSCYNCQCKNTIQSDIILGDYWGVSNLHKDLDTSKGVSFICINTDTGKNAFNNIKDNLQVINTSYDNIYKNNAGLHSKINKNKEVYNKDIFKKNVAIITLPFNGNIGGILQNYALQKVIKSLGYNVVTLNKKESWYNAAYLNELLNIKNISEENYKNETNYDIFIIGSDQILRKTYMYNYSKNYLSIPMLSFTDNLSKVRFLYAASTGVDTNNWEFTKNENELISKNLSQFNALSVRELNTIQDFKTFLGLETASHIDPTLLLTKEDYLELCKDTKTKDIDVFAYILDNNTEKKNKIIDFCNSKNLKKVYIDKLELKDWLACFRDAKYIITDSFHGCIFSIIFNKPFICIVNKNRGTARFETLKNLFKLTNIIISYNDLADSIFQIADTESLNILKTESLTYLKNNLTDIPKNLISSISLNKNTNIQNSNIKENNNTKKRKTNTNNNYLYF